MTFVDARTRDVDLDLEVEGGGVCSAIHLILDNEFRRAENAIALRPQLDEKEPGSLRAEPHAGDWSKISSIEVTLAHRSDIGSHSPHLEIDVSID
jgi:hypothetical protein